MLMINTISLDHIEVNDLTDEELRNAITGWYRTLLPLWKKLKKYIFDFKERVLPEREKMIEADKELNNPTSPLYEYRELQGYGFMEMDKYYSLKISDSSTEIGVSFDSGKVSIFRPNLNAVSSFLDIIKDASIDLFDRCPHCKKVIVVSRKGKRFHSGCAAKALQKEFWKKNRKVAREKEKIRYAERRKKRSLSFD